MSGHAHLIIIYKKEKLRNVVRKTGKMYIKKEIGKWLNVHQDPPKSGKTKGAVK